MSNEKIDPEVEQSNSSLYNLLDHSLNDLDILHGIVKSFTREKIEPIKDSVPAHYTSAIAWIRILESAMKERDKTAKEINEAKNEKHSSKHSPYEFVKTQQGIVRQFKNSDPGMEKK